MDGDGDGEAETHSSGAPAAARMDCTNACSRAGSLACVGRASNGGSATGRRADRIRGCRRCAIAKRISPRLAPTSTLCLSEGGEGQKEKKEKKRGKE